MGVEINRNSERSLQLRHKRGDARRVDQSRHILKSDYLGAVCLHSLGFSHEILISKYLLRLFPKHTCKEPFRLLFLRIDGVAHRAIGNSAKVIDHLYGALHIVKVIECVENTHDVKSIVDCRFIETIENGVGVRHIAKQVTPA